MASTNGYETKTSSLLTAAGSPLNAASTSVCKISRTRGRLPRNSTVNLCASPVMSFLARPSGGLYSRLLRISSSSFPRIESSNAAVSILISDECINFSSKKPGNSSRNKSCVSAVTTRLDGRFFPSRWLMPPSCAYEATSWLVSCVTVSTAKDLPQRNQETKILSGWNSAAFRRWQVQRRRAEVAGTSGRVSGLRANENPSGDSDRRYGERGRPSGVEIICPGAHVISSGKRDRPCGKADNGTGSPVITTGSVIDDPGVL